jgi:hypothetical protein
MVTNDRIQTEEGTLSRPRTGGRTWTCSQRLCEGSIMGSAPISGATDSTMPDRHNYRRC